MDRLTKVLPDFLATLVLIAGLTLCFVLSVNNIVWAQSVEQNENDIQQIEYRDTITENVDAQDNESTTPYKYWGNSFSFKFHRPDCIFAQCMSKKHRVFFHFRHEAIEAHFAPCKYCLPPVWREVHGVLLLPKKDNVVPDGIKDESRHFDRKQ